MRRTVSLSEFMPYGAPELLAAGRPHLAGALSAASATAALLFVVALLLAPLIRTRPAIPPVPPVTRFGPPPYDPQPPVAEPTLPRVSVSPPSKPKAAVPVPVPEVPPLEPAPSSTRTGDQPSDNASGPNSSEPNPLPPVVEHLPALGEFVPVDELPVPITEFKPKYPEIARDAGVDGMVMVQALVGKDGHVLRVVLDPKFSIPLLNEAALEGAKHWVFKPAFANGHPVAVWFAIPYRFVLNE